MRIVFLLSLALMLKQPCFSQYNLIDSLHILLKKEKTDTGKAVILFNLSYAYQTYKPDSALLLAQQAYELSVKQHYLKGESWALSQMAGAFSRMGNNTQALEYYLRQLKIEEELKNSDNLASINMNIALVYNKGRDTAKAIYYILKADSVIREKKLDYLQLYGLLNTGDIFEKANRLPEALAFTRQCYTLALKNNDSLMIGSALNNMGNIYSKSGDLDKAITSYQSSEPFLKAMNDYQSISEGKLGLSSAFIRKAMPDSALQYAVNAYAISSGNGFLKNALSASTVLSNLYKQQGKIDSAFAYQEIMVNLKDSIEGIEKIKQLENMSIQEELRQQHLAAMEQQEKEEQHQKLQLLAIGIFIPVCFLISMYISRKKVHRRVIEFSGILSLLLLFEYITLFIHPFVADITHHSPALEILILVCIAAMVVPAHHRIEGWFKQHLTSMHDKHMHKGLPPASEAPAPDEQPLNEI